MTLRHHAAAALVAATGLLPATAQSALQDHFLYYPSRAPLAAMLSPGFRPWPSDDPEGFRGLLAEPGQPASPRATAIIFHGNAGHAGHRKDYAAALAAHGVRVILAEYPGYGPRPGTVGEASFVDDAVGIVAAAWKQFGPPLVLIGESLGAGVAAATAARQPELTSAVMLITPWDRLASVASWHYPWLPVSWLLTDRYDSAANLASFSGPVLVVTAQKDTIVPPKFGAALHDSLAQASEGAPRALREIPAAGHNDWFARVDADWWREAVGFLLAPVARR